jgi:hypothetical protein
MARNDEKAHVSPKQLSEALERKRMGDLLDKLEGTIMEDLPLLTPAERVKVYVDLMKYVSPKGCGTSADATAKPSADTDRVKSLFAAGLNLNNRMRDETK